jgi:hypothetical protein
MKNQNDWDCHSSKVGERLWGREVNRLRRAMAPRTQTTVGMSMPIECCLLA